MRLFSSRMKGSLRLTKSKVSLRKLEFASHGFTFLLHLSLAKSPSVLPERAHPPCLLPSTPPRPVSPRGLKPAFLTLCLWHQLPGLEMSQGADPSDGKPGAGGPFLYPVPPPRLPALGTHETPSPRGWSRQSWEVVLAPHPLRRKGAEESGPGEPGARRWAPRGAQGCPCAQELASGSSRRRRARRPG